MAEIMTTEQRQKQEAEYQRAWRENLPSEDVQRENPLAGLGASLISEFLEAQLLRQETEQRWLTDLRQYRGQYEPEEEALMQGSKAFARKTRVKVKSVDARLMDMLFPASKERNYSISATPEPSVPASRKKSIVQAMTQANGAPPSPEDVQEVIRKFADDSAAKMATRIDDQLTEAKYRATCKDVMHSGHLYGTGILKGPLVERRTRHAYKWDGKRYTQTTRTYTAPFMAHVPIWRFYPDMTVTRIEDCRYTWEHHRLGRQTLAEMAERKTFNRQAILSYIDTNPDGAIKLMRYEQDLRAIGQQENLLSTTKTGQYDVYERWGWLKAEELLACGIDVPQDRMHETFYSNVWALPDGQVIKAVLSPMVATTSTYHLYYLDKDETSIFADGYAAIMRDDQGLINSALRMAVDNAAVCAGPEFEVDTRAFPVGTDITNIHPLKVWPRNGGDFQYPAIRALNFDSHTAELMQLMDKFDAQSDETTAIPKFTYAGTGERGAAETAQGLSMLMGQANISLKDLVVNWDEGITKPFIANLYHWNMQFSKDDTIKGDYDVVATGAASLVAKEVRANTLSQFAATMQPEIRPYIKWESLGRQMAQAQELEDLIKTQEEVDAEMNTPEGQAQAQMAQMQQQIAMQTMQVNLAKMQAQVALAEAQVQKLTAEAQREIAEVIDAKVKSAYSAMQAAGVIVANPGVAPVGDALLKEAGWVGATQEAAMQEQAAIQEQQVQQQEQQAQQMLAPGDEPAPDAIENMTPDMMQPEEPDVGSPAVGQEAGIETVETEEIIK